MKASIIYIKAIYIYHISFIINLYYYIAIINVVVYSLGEFITYNENYQIRYGRIVAILRIDDSQDYCIKLEHILEFDSLPIVLRSQQRRIASCNGYLWMTDNTVIIDTTNIMSKVNIWLVNVDEPDNYQYSIDEIVYSVNRQWMTRPIDL